MEARKIIQVEEKVPVKLLIPLSIQHMFAMFGASVLVPFLFGISPAIVLFMNGVGTLIFIAVTKGKAPAYLGSSFAFLAPAGIVNERSSIKRRSPKPLETLWNSMTLLPRRSATGIKISLVSLRLW